MQPVADQYKAPTKIHEQVVANMRRENENLASAYSNEKLARIRLQEEINEKDYRLNMQERELVELRMQNERLIDSERISIRQIEELKQNVSDLSLNNEN